MNPRFLLFAVVLACAQLISQGQACEYEPLQCTRDINECGNPGWCACPPDTEYSPSSGTCLYEARYGGSPPDGFAPAKSAPGPCVLPPDNICTMDLNVCGKASICLCPGGFDYSAANGMCLKPFWY